MKLSRKLHWLVTASFFFAGTSFSAKAQMHQEVPYHPEACHKNAFGKKYLAIQSTIFAASSLGPPSISASGHINSPRADDLEQPGCPDNPIPVASLRHAEEPAMIKFAESLGFRNLKVSLYAWPVPSETVNLPAIPDISSQWRNSDFVIQMCHEKKTAGGNITTNQVSGPFRMCQIPFDHDSDKLTIGEYATGFIINKTKYSTEAGDDFTVYCGPGASRWDISPCEVKYAMWNGLGLSYTFQPRSVFDKDLLDNIMHLDSFIRSKINESIYYPKQNTATTNRGN